MVEQAAFDSRLERLPVGAWGHQDVTRAHVGNPRVGNPHVGNRIGDLVDFCTDFLDDHASLGKLVASDLIVFPYQNTGESASGAVRYGLAGGRPVAVMPLAIFDDVQAVTFRLPGQTPQETAAGIAALMDDVAAGAPRVGTIQAEAGRWRAAHRYSRLGERLGERLYNMMNALHAAAVRFSES